MPANPKLSYGVVGIGSFAPYLVQGLIGAGIPAASILISRRGRNSKSVGEAHGVIRVNLEEIAAGADIVLVATPSPLACDVLAGCTWLPRTLIISVCAGVPLARLQAAAGPATAVSCLPLSTAAFGASPVLLYPENDRARGVLEAFGDVIAVQSEAELATGIALFCLHTWLHELIQHTEDWAYREGFRRVLARRIAAANFVSAGQMVLHEPETAPGRRMAAMATPGGISEVGLDILRDAEWTVPLGAALSAARARCGAE